MPWPQQLHTVGPILVQKTFKQINKGMLEIIFHYKALKSFVFLVKRTALEAVIPVMSQIYYLPWYCVSDQ